MLDWLGQMLDLPSEFLAKSGGRGGGVIQGTASEATLVALLGAKAKILHDLKKENPDWTDEYILPKLVGYCSSKLLFYTWLLSSAQRCTGEFCVYFRE